MDGLLLIDKPKDWTSHDIVAKVRGVLKKSAGHKVKVGHTGTLDPSATGLMVLVVGSYCKRAQEFSKLDKVYEVEMTLGSTSYTGDSEGELTKISTHKPTKDELSKVCEQFVGDISQVPPAYSAIKVDGKRAYKLAREGKEVKLEPRQVTIYSLDVLDYDYPVVQFRCKVSSGTYIRSLVEDIGKVLETGAYMSQLRRTSIDSFRLDKSISIEDIADTNLADRLIQL